MFKPLERIKAFFSKPSKQSQLDQAFEDVHVANAAVEHWSRQRGLAMGRVVVLTDELKKEQKPV